MRVCYKPSKSQRFLTACGREGTAPAGPGPLSRLACHFRKAGNPITLRPCYRGAARLPDCASTKETKPVNDDAVQAATDPSAEPEAKVTYSVSPGFSSFLGSNRIALAVSSYQSGKFYLLGQNMDGGLIA